MRKIVEGNIIEADVQALVNTVNTVGVMGKGIALQFHRAFPEMFKSYEAACKSKTLQPGMLHVFDRGQILNPRYIINFPTKRHWKGKSKIADIESGLDALVKELRTRGISSVAIPPLGCGNGGLDWEDVLPLIERAMDRVPEVEVLIYTPTGAPEPAKMVNRTKRPEMTATLASMLRLLSDYRVLGYDLTLIEIQKILYFFQVAGEPLKLQFVKHHYGPYTDGFRNVLKRIEGHFLEGFGDGNHSPEATIQLFDDAVSEAVEVSERSSSPEQQDRVRRVFDLIEGFESPYGLELLASVHWVVIEGGVPNEPDSVVRAIQDWTDRKRQIMRADHIRVAWERLNDLGWLRPGVATPVATN